ncbi:hypothetical protein CspHIS471_0104410 [Cutaneotrichosporon sp. HIS471]|nr:hypothetical protein CspHIS471_0104410 [Cutaneotrichosporon sp. HIS471]
MLNNHLFESLDLLLLLVHLGSPSSLEGLLARLERSRARMWRFQLGTDIQRTAQDVLSRLETGVRVPVAFLACPAEDHVPRTPGDHVGPLSPLAAGE